MGAIKEIAELTAKRLTPDVKEYFNPFDWKGGGINAKDKLVQMYKPYLDTGKTVLEAQQAMSLIMSNKVGKQAATTTLQLLTPLNRSQSESVIATTAKLVKGSEAPIKAGVSGLKKVAGVAKEVGKDAIAHPVYATAFLAAGEVAQAVGDHFENDKSATRIVRGAGATAVAAGITAALLGSVSLGVGIGYVGIKAIKGSLKG